MFELQVPAKEFDAAIREARLKLGTDANFGHAAWIYERACVADARVKRWEKARRAAAVFTAATGLPTLAFALTNAGPFAAQTASALQVSVTIRLALVFLASAGGLLASSLMVVVAKNDQISWWFRLRAARTADRMERIAATSRAGPLKP